MRAEDGTHRQSSKQSIGWDSPNVRPRLSLDI